MARQARLERILELHQKYPLWSAAEIARYMGCPSATVRATAQRKGLTLGGSQPEPAKPDTASEVRR